MLFIIVIIFTLLSSTCFADSDLVMSHKVNWYHWEFIGYNVGGLPMYSWVYDHSEYYWENLYYTNGWYLSDHYFGPYDFINMYWMYQFEFYEYTTY